jgi:two-component system phosphate regulon sensor histidine kinase PhoR
MQTTSLTRRLIDRYLLYGLAGLFCFLVLALHLAWREQLINLVALATLTPLVILLLGALSIRQTARLNSEIERHLCRLAEVPSSAQVILPPLADAHPAAVGWNQVRDRVTRQQALTNLETRLAGSLGGVRQRRLEDALNSLSDGVAVTDSGNVITFANRSFATIFGLKPEEPAVGRRVPDVLATAAPGKSEQLRAKAASPVSPLVFEVRRSDETAAGILRVERSRLVSGEEQTTAYVWSIRDVTQQKLADEMRNQFVFTATHELRTPLTNIKAYAETLSLEDGIDVEQQKQFCNIINAEATRLSRFIDELLNVSQMESGALSLARSETDTARLLEEVIEHVQPEMRRKRIEFATALPAKLPKLHVDKDKMAAALVNLLGNAAKYTPEEGRVRLHVEVEAQQLLVHVEDSGIGIAKEELPKIFDKFFRSSDQRVRDINGSGLGLAFTQEVTRLHGGQLVVHSELNKGSKFTMQLPIA